MTRHIHPDSGVVRPEAVSANPAKGFQFMPAPDEIKPLIEKALDSLLAPSVGCPGALLEAMRYSVLAPGKRTRPTLALLAARSVATRVGLHAPAFDPIPAACAVEMVHVYSLVHDDLPAMDDDDMRRGQPTCHKKYGEAMAILAGDALLTLAFETLARHYPGPLAGHCCLELAKAAGPCGMVGGQVADLAAEGRINDAEAPTTLEGLESLHRRKTGQLIVASLRIGALAGSGKPDQPETLACLADLTKFGESLGLAFQIVDDLLDVSGSLEKTGKMVGKDAARGKLTYPGLLGEKESRGRANRLSHEAVSLMKAWNGAGDSLIDMAQRLLDRET
ncbi:MAG: polyprenyl synthetase family protein [Planctomycetes bacterium]|nr:polyprenyl synthetase family protein [Planctomycetota bacterium]